MHTYTIYEPQQAPDNIEAHAASLVFVKEGFCFSAFLLPPVWFLTRRLWFASAIYGGALTIIVLLAAGLSNLSLFLTLLFVGHLIIGFEARDILRAELELRDYVLQAVVSARDLAECEHRYLQTWLPEAKLAHGKAIQQQTITQGSVIGMFPEKTTNIPRHSI